MILSGDTELIGAWVFEQIGKPWHPWGRHAIGLVSDTNDVLAGVVFEDYTGACVSLHIAIAHPNVPLRKLITATAEYAFNQLGVKKVIGLVPSDNKAALALDLRLGFSPEAILKGIYPTADLVVLSMTREECRFLRPSGVHNGEKGQGSEGSRPDRLGGSVSGSGGHVDPGGERPAGVGQNH